MNHKYLLQLASVVLFAGTIFLGAFLLFQVQPLIGRFLLPWFGGTPEVWTTCMLFFQVFLLGGYAYAHFLIRMKHTRLQPVIHIGLLVAALLFLPILPNDVFKPTANDNPVLQILLICSVTVGLPYLLLSATSPLIQGWFAKAFPKRNPYRLYALSNAGSLLALASFPFVFEPLMSRKETAIMWSICFGVFAILCAGCALLGRNHSVEENISDQRDATSSPTWAMRLLWLALPAGASVELLAVTNKITQDIAVIPFLWVLPLGLYLLSFIICFEHQRWYKRWIWVPLFIAGIIGVIYARIYEQDMMSIKTLIGLYVFMLFTCCMVCHGELYRMRPKATHLTEYYLMISAGGALGGFFVAVICPLIFNVYIELYLGLLFCALFLMLGDQNVSKAYAKRRRFWVVTLCIVGSIGVLSMGKRTTDNQTAIDNSRNFFGVLTILDESPDDPDEHKLLMQHGTTFHGLQFQAPEKKLIPTAYYSANSGIGLVMQNFEKQDNRRIGIIGLGVGTIAIYGNANDTIRFYEINPDVMRFAKQYFTYLEESKAKVEMVLGDGRLSMENEAPQQYDILVLDAFSSDAVPIHLLTTEAMEIYLNHLGNDGVLAFHISTMHLDLQSVIWKLAEHFNLQTAWIESFEDETPGALASDWILLARDGRFLSTNAIKEMTSPPHRDRKDISVWTDDHINLLEIIRPTPGH